MNHRARTPGWRRRLAAVANRASAEEVAWWKHRCRVPRFPTPAHRRLGNDRAHARGNRSVPHLGDQPRPAPVNSERYARSGPIRWRGMAGPPRSGHGGQTTEFLTLLNHPAAQTRGVVQRQNLPNLTHGQALVRHRDPLPRKPGESHGDRLSRVAQSPGGQTPRTISVHTAKVITFPPESMITLGRNTQHDRQVRIYSV